MDCAVDGETRRIDRPGIFVHLVALQVDLHQARGGDFVEQHSVGIDEEVMFWTRNPRSDMRENRRSSQWKWATRRYAAAKSTRTTHSSGEKPVEASPGMDADLSDIYIP